MSDDPQAERLPERRMSREGFQALLFEVRNGANFSLIGLAVEDASGGQSHDRLISDVRAVWHAAEVALGILSPGYMPKREALDDVRAMMAWLDDNDKRWLSRD